MKDLKDLLGKKSKIDPIEKEAKLRAIKNMKKAAGDLMADEMKGMKKVTVAAPDEESLAEGLETAKDLTEEMPEMDMMEDEDTLEDILEDVSSVEEIDELMAKLAEKKAALSME